MPADDVELLRALYGRWAAGDLRAGAELLDEHIVSVWPADFPTSGAYLGADAHSSAMREWLSACRSRFGYLEPNLCFLIRAACNVPAPADKHVFDLLDSG